MNLLDKLERLQAANKRLAEENKSLKAINDELMNDMKSIRESAKMSLDKSEQTMNACERLRTVYEENIAIAKSAQKKYEELYRECLKIKKQMLKEIGQ